MRMPYYFIEWFDRSGLLDDGWKGMDVWMINRIRRIAWRAYRKGAKDEKNRIFIKEEG